MTALNSPPLVELEPVLVRGISTPIKIFEVRWQPDASIPSPILQFKLEATGLSAIPERVIKAKVSG